MPEHAGIRDKHRLSSHSSLRKKISTGGLNIGKPSGLSQYAYEGQSGARMLKKKLEAQLEVCGF